MFLSVPNLSSVNSARDLPQGEYQHVMSEYQSLAGDIKAILNEYFLDGDPAPTACDLFIVLETEEVLFADYLRLNDLQWRDCNGEIAANLQALLPGEISALRLVEREQQGKFHVHNGKVIPA